MNKRIEKGLVQGGQGRSESEVLDAAWGVLLLLVLAGVLAAMLALGGDA